MTDAQTEARAIVTAALPPHEQAILGHDAVTVLTDLIATALAAKDAELAAANYAWRAMKDRAHAAEAQLAEANKALEPFAVIADTEDAVGRDDPDDDRVWVVQAHGCQIGDLTTEDFRAARRALEAQGGENG